MNGYRHVSGIHREFGICGKYVFSRTDRRGLFELSGSVELSTLRTRRLIDAHGVYEIVNTWYGQDIF